MITARRRRAGLGGAVRAIGAAAAVVTLAASPALAHRVDIDAAIVGDAVEGDAFFDDGAPCRDARVEVLDGEERVADGRTDRQGAFRVALPAAVLARARAEGARGLRVIVNDGAGHRAEATLEPPLALGPDAGDAAARAAEERRLAERRREEDRGREERRRRADARRGEDRRRRRIRQVAVALGVVVIAAWYRRRRHAAGPPPPSAA